MRGEVESIPDNKLCLTDKYSTVNADYFDLLLLPIKGKIFPSLWKASTMKALQTEDWNNWWRKLLNFIVEHDRVFNHSWSEVPENYLCVTLGGFFFILFEFLFQSRLGKKCFSRRTKKGEIKLKCDKEKEGKRMTARWPDL
jgi:hypothetical protein